MTQNKFYFPIVGGPSKFDLMLSLFDGNKTPRRTVEFHLKDARRTIHVAITLVSQESGSGESWNFEGWISDDDPLDLMFTLNLRVHGYFSTKDRSGSLTFEAPFHYDSTSGVRMKVILPANQIATEQYIAKLRS